MMKNLLLATVVLLALCGIASAVQIGTKEYDTYYDSMVANQEKYNKYMDGQSLPGVLKPFVSERIDLIIDGEVIGLELKDAKVVSLTQGGIENPTVRITTSGAFIQKVVQSPKPIPVVVEGLESGELQKEDIGVVSKIKGTIFKISLKLFSRFL